jgi:nicotinate phosphoribosyltransferase
MLWRKWHARIDMMRPSQLYRPSLALLTDLYQLTMAYAAFRSGMADREATFHLSFRRTPYEGGYAVACGVEDAIDFMSSFKWGAEDLAYLGSVTGGDGKPLFERDFLKYLDTADFGVDVDALPEGTAVFPHEPLVRVRGSIIPCMLFETPLLNAVNFQTLIATKAENSPHRKAASRRVCRG